MATPFLVSRTELESSRFLNRRASTVLFCWPLALIPSRRAYTCWPYTLALCFNPPPSDKSTVWPSLCDRIPSPAGTHSSLKTRPGWNQVIRATAIMIIGPSKIMKGASSLAMAPLKPSESSATRYTDRTKMRSVEIARPTAVIISIGFHTC